MSFVSPAPPLLFFPLCKSWRKVLLVIPNMFNTTKSWKTCIFYSLNWDVDLSVEEWFGIISNWISSPARQMVNTWLGVVRFDLHVVLSIVCKLNLSSNFWYFHDMIFAYVLRFVSMFFQVSQNFINKKKKYICRISHFPCTLALQKIAFFLQNIDTVLWWNFAIRKCAVHWKPKENEKVRVRLGCFCSVSKQTIQSALACHGAKRQQTSSKIIFDYWWFCHVPTLCTWNTALLSVLATYETIRLIWSRSERSLSPTVCHFRLVRNPVGLAL